MASEPREHVSDTDSGHRARLFAGLPVTERRLEVAGVSTAVLEGGAGPRIILAPPRTWPTSTGGDEQVRSMSPLSHARKPSASSRPSTSFDVPCPGRSGATTRCVVNKSGMTGIHIPGTERRQQVTA